MTRSASLKRQLAEQLDATVSTAAPGPVTDARLRPLVQTAEQLARLWQQPVPSPHGKLQFGRAQLLAAVAYRSRRSSFGEQLTVEMRFAAKFLAALIALLVVLAPLSPGLVGAARDSMPGQLFYPLKLHMERVQFRGVEEPDVRVSLGLAFLGERVAEAQALAGTGRTLDYETVAEVYQLVNQVLDAVAHTPEADMPDNLVYVSRQLGAYLDVLETLEAQAAPSNAASLNQIRRAVQNGHLLALNALEDPTAFRSAYQAGRPELFLAPGEYPLGEQQAPFNAITNTHQEK
jgi:hypothetical protein